MVQLILSAFGGGGGRDNYKDQHKSLQVINDSQGIEIPWVK